MIPSAVWAALVRRECSDMNRETTGTVVRVTTQWWLKINTKPVRMHAMDGAIFPHVIKVKYTVDGTDYFKRKWIRAGDRAPDVGNKLTVTYCEENPKKAKII